MWPIVSLVDVFWRVNAAWVSSRYRSFGPMLVVLTLNEIQVKQDEHVMEVRLAAFRVLRLAL